MACYEQAAALYQQALHLAHTPGTPPPASKVADCRFSLAETLQNWAETLLQATAALPDANLSRSQERQAQSQARSLFEEAAKQYNEVKDTPEAPPASLRVDAAVCCGNTLAAWAQLVADPGEAGALLTHAQRCYQAALLKEEDAMVSLILY